MRENPDVDVFVMDEDFDRAIDSVQRLEKKEDAVRETGTLSIRVEKCFQ